MKIVNLRFLTIGLSFYAPPSRAADVVLTQHNISAEAAFTIARAAISACHAQGYDVSVVVVDREGIVRLGVRADSAAPHNYELARRKAYTARTFRRPTSEWLKLQTDRPELNGQRSLSEVIALGGGVPINFGSETIGGVGVSGAPGQDKDEICAAAGVAAIAADLKSR